MNEHIEGATTQLVDHPPLPEPAQPGRAFT